MIAVRHVAGTWTCGICCQSNDDDWGRCVLCNQERGDWVCPCGRKNRKGDAECSECGAAREDE